VSLTNSALTAFRSLNNCGHIITEPAVKYPTASYWSAHSAKKTPNRGCSRQTVGVWHWRQDW